MWPVATVVGSADLETTKLSKNTLNPTHYFLQIPPIPVPSHAYRNRIVRMAISAHGFDRCCSVWLPAHNIIAYNSYLFFINTPLGNGLPNQDTTSERTGFNK